jgi:hypothetical protein
MTSSNNQKLIENWRKQGGRTRVHGGKELERRQVIKDEPCVQTSS